MKKEWQAGDLVSFDQITSYIPVGKLIRKSSTVGYWFIQYLQYADVDDSTTKKKLLGSFWECREEYFRSVPFKILCELKLRGESKNE